MDTLNMCLKSQCKGNWFKLKTCGWENIQNMLRKCHFTGQVKYAHILARFGCFLSLRLSVWTDLFCIVSGYLRHKFRVPTKSIWDKKKNPFYFTFYPLGGVWKTFYGGKQIFPDCPYTIGNQIRYLRKTLRGEWHIQF